MYGPGSSYLVGLAEAASSDCSRINHGIVPRDILDNSRIIGHELSDMWRISLCSSWLYRRVSNTTGSKTGWSLSRPDGIVNNSALVIRNMREVNLWS